MFIWNWIKNLLRSWGLLNKEGNMIFLGLDGAGKTTLLHLMKYNKILPQDPTQMPIVEEFTYEKLNVKATDMGGHEARAVWKDYLNELTAIVFIVDASNRDRIEESRGELEKLLSDPRLKTTPFLILGNKIDLAGAMSETDLKQNLGITLSTTGKSQPVPKGGRPMEVFMCSLIRNRGYKEGIQWLSQFF